MTGVSFLIETVTLIKYLHSQCCRSEDLDKICNTVEKITFLCKKLELHHQPLLGNFGLYRLYVHVLTLAAKTLDDRAAKSMLCTMTGLMNLNDKDPRNVHSSFELINIHGFIKNGMLSCLRVVFQVFDCCERVVQWCCKITIVLSLRGETCRSALSESGILSDVIDVVLKEGRKQNYLKHSYYSEFGDSSGSNSALGATVYYDCETDLSQDHSFASASVFTSKDRWTRLQTWRLCASALEALVYCGQTEQEENEARDVVIKVLYETWTIFQQLERESTFPSSSVLNSMADNSLGSSSGTYEDFKGCRSCSTSSTLTSSTHFNSQSIQNISCHLCKVICSLMYMKTMTAMLSLLSTRG